MTPKKIIMWVIAVLGSGGVFTLLFWGVPYYLKSTVHDLYVAEAEAAPAPSVPAAVVENTAAVKALGTQLSGMETRMIELKVRVERLQNKMKRNKWTIPTKRQKDQRQKQIEIGTELF